ncbi:MAG: ABC transporter permease [Anaerolineaceae bacterium]|nr:ABC transporter permease [Anaerolineaceae bacterium]
MSELEATNIPNEPTQNPIPPTSSGMALDDARRVKTLSPGMLVFKRFIRNKLAVIGLIILLLMFAFSFLGPFLSPYTQTQVFYKKGTISKDYAGAIYNTDLRYSVREGEIFGGAEQARFLLSLGKDQPQFSSGGKNFAYIKEGEGFYRIVQLEKFAEAIMGRVNPLPGNTMPLGFAEAFEEANDAGEMTFDFQGTTYVLTRDRKTTQISTQRDVAIGSYSIFDAYKEENNSQVNSFEFRLNSQLASINDEESFTADGEEYRIVEDEAQVTIIDEQGEPFAEISNIIVNPLDQNEFLSVEFKAAARDTIVDRKNTFEFPGPDGEMIEYEINRVNTNYYIKRETTTTLINMFEFPSITHPLGLDNNGMDMMTRLMYGGRVSLMVGFVAVFLELIIGIVIGGVSGFFGGSVDTALMRFVDLFNSIPQMPLILIFGSVMDTLEVDPMQRMFILMAILGFLGWTGIARVVRGQILSLREQDFMVATEATGIRTTRKIFRHLIPNVMPILIVSATASLGGLIITEATLGFLGLGIKYPLASWGSIINISSDAFIMSGYWFMWIPAGALILLTVLGFNFVGDGLRDAYDPRMRR